jgi:hypothetical protein
MNHLELELYDANPLWGVLLAAYQLRHTSASLEWVSRLTAVEGLADDQLSLIHGKLIALGMLKFEIGDRAEGVHYQVTTLGRQALIAPESRQLVPEWMQVEEAESAAA